ncbi:MAG: Sporulation related domain [Bacteroidetes bacterium]|nr:Sporulation related domain [Bacteroidota bacterium]
MLMHKARYPINSFLPAIAIILLFIFLPSCRYLREKGIFLDKNVKSILLQASQDSILRADSLIKTGTFANSAIEPQQDPEIRIEDQKLSGEEIDNKYYIIIGSFSNTENAKLAASQYTGQGYNTSIIQTTDRNGKRIELVSARTFEDYDEAVSYLKDFQSNIDPGAWIYPRK